jgi:hypothetical protein
MPAERDTDPFRLPATITYRRCSERRVLRGGLVQKSSSGEREAEAARAEMGASHRALQALSNKMIGGIRTVQCIDVQARSCHVVSGQANLVGHAQVSAEPWSGCAHQVTSSLHAVTSWCPGRVANDEIKPNHFEPCVTRLRPPIATPIAAGADCGQSA